MKGISAFMKETPQSSLALSTMLGHSEEALARTKKWALTKSALTLDLKPPRL